jgi:hypothetical protein
MKDAPFSQGYVLTVTHDNVSKAIDRSIRKTTGRLGDEDMDADKKAEILRTLVSLNTLHNLWQEVKEENIKLFDADNKDSQQ